MLREDEAGLGGERPKAMFKTLRRLHGQNLDHAGLNNLTEAFAAFMTRARFFSIGHLRHSGFTRNTSARRTWSHSAVEFMKYRRRLPALLSTEDNEYNSDDGGTGLTISEIYDETQPVTSSKLKPTFKIKTTELKDESTFANRKIFVSNVSSRATTTQLASFFSKFGKVITCTLPFDKHGKTMTLGRRKPRGIAYVTFKNSNCADLARKAPPSELKFYDKVMVVAQALPIKSKNTKEPVSPTDSINSFCSVFRDYSKGDELSESESESVTSPCILPFDGKSIVTINHLNDKTLAQIISLLDPLTRIKLERVSKRFLEMSFASWIFMPHLTLNKKLLPLSASQIDINANLKSILHRCGRHIIGLSLAPGIGAILDDQSINIISDLCPVLNFVDFTGLKVSWQALRAFAENCPTLHHLIMRNVQGMGEKAFWYLFRNCKNLQTVNLQGCKRLEGRCFRLLGLFLEEVYLDGCARLQVESIEELCLKSQNLRVLTLDACANINDAILSQISRSLPCLQKLSLCGSKFKDQSSLGLSYIGTMDCLKELRLDYNNQLDDKSLASICEGCVSLQILSISGASKVSETGIGKIGLLRNLKELNVSNLKVVNDRSMEQVLSSNKSPNFTHLCVSDCPLFGDWSFQLLANQCHQLIELDLRGCISISNQGINQFLSINPAVDNLPAISLKIGGTNCELTKLNLNGSRVVVDCCTNIMPAKGYWDNTDFCVDEFPSDEENISDDEFESLTAQRSFVVDTLEEDDHNPEDFDPKLLENLRNELKETDI